MKKLLLESPLLKPLYMVVKSYFLRHELHKKAERDRRWESKFDGNKGSFVFLLNPQTKITLYKDSILSRFIYEGEFEKNEIAFLKSKLKEGDIFIDIGANIGLYSLIAATKVGKTGKIISFEPSPETFNRLRNNILLNSFDNIEARNMGLSDSNGFLKLNISKNGYDAWNTFATNKNNRFNETVEVPVHTLDNQLKDVPKERIALVKIDVEGWEKFVLEGGEDFFKTYAPSVMVEFTDSNTKAAGYNVHELYDIMQEWGYTWFKYVHGKLVEEKRSHEFVDDNLIAIKSR